MSDSFQKKSASIIASVFIGFIILSFLFSGYYTRFGGNMGPENVASVDGTNIKMVEYHRLLTERLELLKKLMRVSELTSQQIEQFNIKQSVLNMLIDQKLFLNLAAKAGINPNDEEVASEIQEQPYFKTGDKFDFELYKHILGRNGLTPSEYEKMVADEIRGRTIFRLINSVPVSQASIEQRNQLKNNAVKVVAVQINKDSLRSFLDISPERIQKYADDPKQQKKIEAFFNIKKSELDQPEEVQVRHILLRVNDNPEENADAPDAKNKVQDKDDATVKKKIEEIAKSVTPANFAKIAEEKSEDPSAKKNGGSLGWIRRGQMVPEFEKVAFLAKVGTISAPVKTEFGYHLIYVENRKEPKTATLKEFKNQIVKELIERESIEERKKLEEKVAAEIKSILQTEQGSLLTKIDNPNAAKSAPKTTLDLAQEKYKFRIEKRYVTPLDDEVGMISISPENIASLFKVAKGKPEILTFNDANFTTLILAERSSYSPAAAQQQAAVAASSGSVNGSTTTSPTGGTNNPAPAPDSELNQRKVFAEQLRADLLKTMRDQAKINIQAKLL